MVNISASFNANIDNIEDAANNAQSSGTFTISQEPMKVYLGQLKTAADADTAQTQGWNYDFNFEVNDTTTLAAVLDKMQTLSKQCYLSLNSGMASTANIDTMLADADFDHVDGVEVEGGSWNTTLWTYLRDEMISAGVDHKLYAYSDQFNNPGSFPNAAVWGQRSQAWYPWAPPNPTKTWASDSTIAAVNITGATAANPVVITATAHGYSDGDTVTIRSCGGMVEINDRQFIVANSTANTFELTGENGTGHTAYTSGGEISEADSTGRTKDIAVRFDPSHESIRSFSSWKHANYTNRETHMWLQAWGQPMTAGDWDDEHRAAVQPGRGHMMYQLWASHIAGCRKVSYFSTHNQQYVNRHANSTEQGSGYNYLWDYDNNTATNLTAEQAGRYERTWARIIDCVDAYMAGPGTWPINADATDSYETPWVGVVTNGQSATRLDSSTN